MVVQISDSARLTELLLRLRTSGYAAETLSDSLIHVADVGNPSLLNVILSEWESNTGVRAVIVE
jgi:hypothetical protein